MMASDLVETGTIFDRILARTAADVQLRREATPTRELARRIAGRRHIASLRASLECADVAVIAEFKRASPSRGRFGVELDPGRVAVEYIEGGAAAISVLTDEPYFQGSLADLSSVAELAHRPGSSVAVLRKDFIVDDHQIVEAAAFGADAILLIVAALTDAALARFSSFAGTLDLECLVEVHDEEEMRRASALGFGLIGINNRDLRTFEVDLAVTERLAPLAPRGALLVGESGIFCRGDVERMRRAGVSAVLVGESLVLSPNRVATLRELRGEA